MQQRGGWVPRHPFHVGPAVVCVLLDCCSLISFPVRCAVPHSRTGGQRHLHLLRADFATGDAIHRAFEIDLVGKILMADKVNGRSCWPCNPVCSLCDQTMGTAEHLCLQLQCTFAQGGLDQG